MKKFALGFCVLYAPAFFGCERKPAAPTPAPVLVQVPVAPAPTTPPKLSAAPSQPAAPAVAVGMAHPFSKLSDQAGKPYNAGWAALKAKKYQDAAAAFTEVSTLLPDYLTARLQAARAELLAGNPAATRQQLEELLSRNFIAYAGRAENTKDFALFRTSPEWNAYEQAVPRLRSAYSAGLERGLYLVARSGEVVGPNFVPSKNGDKSEAKLEPKQEVYHYDPDSSRYRPLTATDGHVVAALRSADGKSLAFLTAERVQKDDKKTWFVEPGFGFVSLSTLDIAGPIKLAGGHEELALSFAATGNPLLITSGALPGSEGLEAGTWEIDTAHTGLIKTPASAANAPKGERVVVRFGRLLHSDRQIPADVTLAEDRHSVQLGTGGVITSGRTLAESSLSFSPGQRFFLYAGQFDACAAAKDEKSKAAQNDLFIYEIEKKQASRIDSSASAFETVWLGDYLLAYESGIGAKATINLYDVATRKKTALPLHYGAGFYGLPTQFCAEATSLPATQTAPAAAAPQAAPAAAQPAPPAAPAAPQTP